MQKLDKRIHYITNSYCQIELLTRLGAGPDVRNMSKPAALERNSITAVPLISELGLELLARYVICGILPRVPSSCGKEQTLWRAIKLACRYASRLSWTSSPRWRRRPSDVTPLLLLGYLRND